MEGAESKPVDAGDAPADAGAQPPKKQKMGAKQRKKAKARELEAQGMSRDEARVAAGLKPAQPQPKAAPKPKPKPRPAPPPQNQLTATIRRSRTLAELFGTFGAQQGCMDAIHISACWSTLGRLGAYGAGRQWHVEHAAALAALVSRTIAVISPCKEGGKGEGEGGSPQQAAASARELTGIAHGVAKSGQGRSMRPLLAALAAAMARPGVVAGASAREIATVALAFAKAGHADARLFAALAAAAEGHLLQDRFNAQELSNLAAAFASGGTSGGGEGSGGLFQALARVVERRLGEFNSQGLSNTASAFAKAGHRDAPLFRAMAAMARAHLEAGKFNAQDYSTVAFAFAKAGQFDSELFLALAKHAERHLCSMNTQGLVHSLWAFSKADYVDATLFAALAGAIKHRMATRAYDFNSQDIATTAYSFAKARHMDEGLFAVVARAAEKCVDAFNTQDLVNTTWAFAKLGVLDERLFGAMGKSILKCRLGDLDAPNIANIAWAFHTAGQLGARLSGALAAAARSKAREFGAPELAKLVWTFANAGQTDAALFGALARSVERHLGDFGEEELDNLAWGFTKAGAGCAKIVAQLKQRKRSATGCAAPRAGAAAVDVSKCGRIIIAGGGIGGAAAAVALQSKGFDVLVLETDPSFDARKQGYGLTVQAQSAMNAMGINLAQDDAPSTSHYTFSAEGQILSFFGEAFGSKSKARREVDNSGRFVHIPRQRLRQRLLEPLRPGTVRWNSRLESFSCHGDTEGDDNNNNKGSGSKSGKDGKSGGKSGVTVTLTDGTTLDGALLVGSDGIFSTVRRQLEFPGDRLNYVGLVVVLGIVDESVMAVPLAKRRIFETVDGTARIYAMPFTTTSTMWQLSFPCAEQVARTYMRDTAALKAEVVRRCADWHEPIPELLRNTPLDGMSGYPVYDRGLLEPGTLRPSSQTRRRVTLIGDAAHPMTPFKAQGANQAMSDAVLLADSLVQGVAEHGPRGGFDAALPLFEPKMLRRSARVVAGSRDKAKEMHSALALQPARRAQREADFDMRKALQTLRARGIGARNVHDPRGLDAVVQAEASSPSGAAGSEEWDDAEAPAEAAGDEEEKGGGKRRAEEAPEEPAAEQKRAKKEKKEKKEKKKKKKKL
jgi:2-polyprenyl-6-methoxyphenol hydroxylase-like FAD-dependent oxidoreductase